MEDKIRLGEYISFSEREVNDAYASASFTTDDQGVMRFDYGGEIGIQYNPVTIEQYALMNYNAWIKTGEKKYLDAFFQQVEWLTHHFDSITEDAIAIPYQFEYLDMGIPWYSALDAAHFLSVLSRAHMLKPDNVYLRLMKQSIKFLLLPVEEGGVKSQTEDEHVWIEEYPSKECAHVLNGFQYVIIGLADYLACVDEDAEAKALYEVSVQSLKECVGRYEKYGWLLYEAGAERYHFVPNHYMCIQAQQMRHLHDISCVDKNVNGGALAILPLEVEAILSHKSNSLYPDVADVVAE